jgi:hypothetical protein
MKKKMLKLLENNDRTQTIKQIAEEHKLALISFMCPHCNTLNEMLCQPGPISLRQQCAQCNSWHEYKPRKAKE